MVIIGRTEITIVWRVFINGFYQVLGFFHPNIQGMFLDFFYCFGAQSTQIKSQFSIIHNLTIHQITVPKTMKVLGLSKPFETNIIPSTISIFPHMQGLIKITNKIHQQFEVKDPLFFRFTLIFNLINIFLWPSPHLLWCFS